MTKTEFINFCEHPGLLEESSAEGLKEIIKSYPYFQPAHALLCLSSGISGDITYQEALSQAALRTQNRKRLFLLFQNSETGNYRVTEKSAQPVSIEKEDKEEQPSPKIISDLEHESESEISFTVTPSEDDLLKELVSYPELPLTDDLSPDTNQPKAEITKDEPLDEDVRVFEPDKPRSFSGWLRTLQTQKAEQVGDIAKTSEENRQELVDRFIKTEPRISSPSKADFFSPVFMAKKSVTDDEEIVSETLAKVYEKQGNLQKARRIYQKLILVNPDKSSYFAALIENLDKPAQL